MDYEKKYNEALERARELSKTITGANYEYIFPELKESKDERIRKELIQLISCMHDADHRKKDWIAWLEKQRQEPKKVSIWKHWKNGIAGNGEGVKIYLTKVGNTYNLSSCLSFECDYIELSELDNLMLEKQGEEEYALKSFRDKDVHKFMQYIEKQAKAYEFNLPNRSYDIYAFAKDILHWLEKQCEKKPDDIKSKFKVGDWITDGYIYYKITEILDDRYIIESKYDKRGAILFEYENRYHLWTIEDAKDGDVLASKDRNDILIFRNLDNDKSFSSYYNIKRKGEIGWSNGTFIPANKEQRDLLFQEMKEAGYEWDAERKELKREANLS